MKTKLLLAFFFISIITFGQTPIASFYGNNQSAYGTALTAIPLVHTPSGANQTWNFDQLISLGTSNHSNVAPTGAETTSYPGTTTVLVSASTVGGTTTTSQIYTKNPAGVFSITGLTSSGLTANFNTNNATLGAFPMNYGFSNNDNVAGNYTYTTYAGTFSGTLVTTVDAYGTLSLNDFGSGAYSGSVTRLKTVLNISLNYGIIPNVGTITQTSYSYYDSTVGSGNAIFRATTTAAVVPLASINQTDTTLEKFDTIVLNNSSFALSVLSVKNPVGNTIEINSQNTIDNANISVTDMLGKTIFNVNNQSINGTLEIPVSLSNGMYLITINNESGSITKRIVKN